MAKEHAVRLWNRRCAQGTRGQWQTDSNLKRQIHNNLQSVGLARVAGYTTPQLNKDAARAWLEVRRRLCDIGA